MERKYKISTGNKEVIIMPRVYTKPNIQKTIEIMERETKKTGHNCSVVRTKRIISEVIDRVDIGVVNKFLKGMTELGYLIRKGTGYEVVK